MSHMSSLIPSILTGGASNALGAMQGGSVSKAAGPGPAVSAGGGGTSSGTTVGGANTTPGVGGMAQPGIDPSMAAGGGMNTSSGLNIQDAIKRMSQGGQGPQGGMGVGLGSPAV